ncbi:MAG: CHAT domain-containing protein, partial [Phycisphaerae bacterium]|nr:CHAT domain-containing protein [Phycisphaerae bacterium]
LIASLLALRRAQPAQALQAARTAADLASAVGAAPLQCDAFVQLAQVHRRAGDFESAVHAAHTAVDATERVRSALGAELLRRAYLGRSGDAHEELVLAHLGSAAPDAAVRAMEAAERGKGRSLVERALAAQGDRAAAPNPVCAPDGSPASDLAQARSQLESAYRKMGLGRATGDSAAATHAVAELEARLSRLEIASAGSEAARATLHAAPHLGRVLDALGSQQALVEFFRARGAWIAFVARRGEVRFVQLDATDADIAAASGRLGFQVRKALRDSQAGRSTSHHAAMDALESLGTMLWSPIDRQGALPEQVIVVPHGLLHAIPFSALRCSDSWLIDRHELSVLPCAALLPVLASARNSAENAAEINAKTPLVVGVADSDAPAIRDEAIAVARALGCTPLLDGDASAERVARALAQSSRAHLACHGQFFPEAPSSSGLRLADRWFGSRDVYDLARAPLEVVLSACDTGGLDVRAGDELTGLVHAFMARGAQRVVASLWSANDASSARIVLDMYASMRSLGDHQSLSPRSLRLAQLAERDRSVHPAFWAPFTFTGIHA